MFSTFKINFPDIPNEELREYYKKGLESYTSHSQTIKENLDQYLSLNGSLKASEIEKEWFPKIDAHVFLSHSHKDEKKAIIVSGILETIGLKTFIDSCLWGYADDLLRQIDNKYCVSRRKKNGEVETYDYQSRNRSTAHVHMILNGALMKMMDSTECLMFLDTPNSLKVEDLPNGTGTTDSAWIYSELLMSGCLERRTPIRKSMQYSINESFRMDSLSVE